MLRFFYFTIISDLKPVTPSDSNLPAEHRLPRRQAGEGLAVRNLGLIREGRSAGIRHRFTTAMRMDVRRSNPSGPNAHRRGEVIENLVLKTRRWSIHEMVGKAL